MRGDGPDAAKNQPLKPSPSLVSNVTGSTPVRPISPGVGTPPAGKYMNRRCIVQMSARTATTMTTTYPAAMIIWRLISMLVWGDRFAGTLQYGCGDASSPAIPWPEGLEGKDCGAGIST